MRKKKPCVKITLTDVRPTIFDSKAGGLGYLPHDGDFPRDKEGNQLRLLAQIDCAQVGFAPLPDYGLLQFWILNDDVYGNDFDHPEQQDTFRVIYYPETDPTVTKAEVQAKFVKNQYDDDEYGMPVSGEYGMSFYPAESTEQDWDDDNGEDENQTDDVHHQIGGYPFFTQDDPRTEDSPYDFLLFQLDSDFRNHEDIVLWGDTGVGNFFINTEKLRKLDFSDVLYNWDCC